MKKILLLLLVVFLACSGKKYSDKEKIQKALDSLNIILNRPETPKGFKLYYNCDSLVFFKKVKGDTITILSDGNKTPMTYSSESEFNSFQSFLRNRHEYPPVFPTKFIGDGRIEIVSYREEIFIYRNDSLFECVKDDSEYMNEAIDNIINYYCGKVNKTSITKNLKNARRIYKPIYRTCFLFNKYMFTKGDTVSIENSMHPLYKKVILEKTWKEKNLNCYSILFIDNNVEMTSKFRYVFDENMKFIEWEGCDK